MIVGIGTDIVKIDRLSNNQDDLATRILTVNELKIYKQYNNTRAKEYLAGRFAGKEAIFKALGKPNLVLSKLEILNDQTGKPYCLFEDYKIQISISHEDNYVIAFVIVEKGV